jgi:adhesin transport system membrane fusion protein
VTKKKPENKSSPHSKIINLDFEKDSQLASELKTPPLARYTLSVFFIFFFIIYIWASTTKIDKATSIKGKIVFIAPTQVIQSSIEGSLDKILVKEGQQVNKGQQLVQLKDKVVQAEYASDLEQYSELRAKVARLRVESISLSKKPNYPKNIIKDFPIIIKRENDILETHRQHLRDSMVTLTRQFAYVKNQLKTINPLVKKQVVAMNEKVALEKELNKIYGERLNVQHKAFSKAREELLRANTQLVKISEDLKKTKSLYEGTKIFSPINGFVNNISVQTIGGVLHPGITLMAIVPFKKDLMVYMEVLPGQIGFIKLGASAYVKVDAYDYSIYGGILGKVDRISHDTIEQEMEKGKAGKVFEVNVLLEKNYIPYKNKKLALKPGMSVVVNVHSYKISVLNYILNPFIKTFQEGII